MPSISFVAMYLKVIFLVALIQLLSYNMLDCYMDALLNLIRS